MAASVPPLLPVRGVAAPRRRGAWWAVPASALLHAGLFAAALWLARPEPLPEPREAEPVAVLWEEAEEGQPGEAGAPVGAPPTPPPAEVAPPPQPPVAAAPPMPEVPRPPAAPAPPRVAEVPPMPAQPAPPAAVSPPAQAPSPPPPRLAEVPMPLPLDLPAVPQPVPQAVPEPPRAEAEAPAQAEAAAEELPLPPPPPPPPPPPRAVAQQPQRPQPATPAAQPAAPASRPGTESAQPGITSTPGRATGAVVPPGPDQRYVNASPRYPDQARALGQQGTVVLLLQVGPDGRVTGLVVEQSSGSPTLDLAARRAALEWRFRPAMQDGQPVAGQIRAPVTFRLQ